MYDHEMQDALEEAKQKLKEQDQLLQQLTAGPLIYAMVIGVGERSKNDSPTSWRRGMKVRVVGDSYHRGKTATIRRIEEEEANIELDNGEHDWLYLRHLEQLEPDRYVLVLHEGKPIEVEMPMNRLVRIGDTVKLAAQTLQIVDVTNFDFAGEVGIVRRLMGIMSEVDYQGSIRAVYNGRCETLDKGDRVIIDPSGLVITDNLGKEDEQFVFTLETHVSWDDIGGLTSAKQQMIEAIELPFRHADLYQFYGKKPIKGVLLYGPPGCGKTMLGKATATALADLHGRNGSSGFFYVKGPEILDRFVGVAEATIRGIFERTRRHKQEHGYPGVVFIDEADAILGKRGTGISSDIERTIVPMFLTEMDGLEESGAVVILATNRPDVLDPAVVRDGRVDRKIKVDRPDPSTATEIFELYLDRVPFHNGSTVRGLSEAASLELFSTERRLYEISLSGGNELHLNLGHIVNGGMIAGIVDQATSVALHRDIESGKPQGLRKEDLLQAVEQTYQQNRDLNHKDEIDEFIHDFRDDVVGIHRLRQAVA